MPREIKSKEFTVFISCPDDLKAEKKIVEEVCQEFTEILEDHQIVLKTIEWRKTVIPCFTDNEPQTIIEDQIRPEDYDIYFGMLWKRFGDQCENGLAPTESEFEEAVVCHKKTRRPVITFFFKVNDIDSQNKYEESQLAAISEFKRKYRKGGIYKNFKCNGNFESRDLFRKEVSKTIREIVLKYDSLTEVKIDIPKKQPIDYGFYIPRQVISTQERDNVIGHQV